MFGIISPPTRTSFRRPKTNTVEPVKDATDERSKNSPDQNSSRGKDPENYHNENDKKASEDAIYSSIGAPLKADSKPNPENKSPPRPPPTKSLDITA